MYNLCDIHFHTNKSFDAYENDGGEQFNIDCLCDTYLCGDIDPNNNIKLLCLTDHNFFDYDCFKNMRDKFNSKGVVALPGIEINGDNSVHWIFIFDDLCLEENSKGDELTKYINNLFKYDMSKDVLKQAKKVQPKKQNVIEFVEKIIDLQVDFLAIPHMDKSNGWYKILAKDKGQLDRIKYLLCDGIINGFESKKMQSSIISKINKTEEFIDSHSSEIMCLEEKIEKEKDKITKEILINQKNKKLENLRNERNFLNISNKLSDIIDINDTASVYGSDYHGKPSNNRYDKKKLFFIKSEPSFNGLKFALFDWKSRIFSYDRKEKHSKSTNYIIDKIELLINSNVRKIKLGDGLNSIIGSRGTGKSYLISSLIGNRELYKDSDIYNQIQIKNISFINHANQNILDENCYDYISQKNSLNKEQKNIYDLLAKAPYDFNEFRSGIEKFYSPQKESNKDILNSFIKLNELLKNYINLNKLESQKLDLSFVNSYDLFYKTQTEDLQISNIFQTLLLFLDKMKKVNDKQISSSEEFVKTLDLLVKQFQTIKEFESVKSFLDTGQTFEKILEQLKEIKTIVNEKVLPDMKKQDEMNKRIENIIKRINNNISQYSNNTKNILDDNISKLRNFVHQYIDLLKDTKEKNEDILDLLSESLIDKDIYSFDTGTNIFELQIVEQLNWKKIEKKQIDEIFKNYKYMSFLDSNVLLSIFQKKDFGKYYCERIYPNIDKRRDKFELIRPQLEPTIYFKNNDEKIDWKLQSPGQRSDLLLECILSGNSSKILIIDQPEDDLDNETIFGKIVSRLRTIKLNRQVIIVTHNANLAITSDSDKIIICENNDRNFDFICDSMESRTKYRYHSINKPESEDTILNLACDILEGGKKAIKRRINKVGIRELLYEE